METLLQKGLSATKESRFVEFKVSFDPSDNGEWCELIKDIVAIANTGDGVIFIGLNSDGACSGIDISEVLNIDPAEITDQIFRYTREQLGGIELMRMEKNGQPVAAILITGLLEPIVFEKPGNYQRRNGKPACAFATGSLYFRHSAKSQPATNNDIRRVLKRNLDLLRKELMQGVSKVVKAPLGSTLMIANGEVSESDSPSATPIRIVDDEAAPAYRKLDPDVTHPHRQMDVIRIV